MGITPIYTTNCKYGHNFTRNKLLCEFMALTYIYPATCVFVCYIFSLLKHRRRRWVAKEQQISYIVSSLHHSNQVLQRVQYLRLKMSPGVGFIFLKASFYQENFGIPWGPSLLPSVWTELYQSAKLRGYPTAAHSASAACAELHPNPKSIELGFPASTD